MKNTLIAISLALTCLAVQAADKVYVFKAGHPSL